MTEQRIVEMIRTTERWGLEIIKNDLMRTWKPKA